MSEYSNILKKVSLIGERIKAERKALKFTQTELSQKIGIGEGNRGNFTDWENGRSLPDLQIMLALCEVFDCDLEWLLCNPAYTCKTKVTTDIQAATGISEEAIKVIKEVTNPKRVDKRDEFNKFLTSNGFPDFFESLCIFYLSSVSLQEQIVSLKKQPKLKNQDDIFKYMKDLQLMKVQSYDLNKAFIRLVDEMCPEPTEADSIIHEYAEELSRIFN